MANLALMISFQPRRRNLDIGPGRRAELPTFRKLWQLCGDALLMIPANPGQIIHPDQATLGKQVRVRSQRRKTGRRLKTDHPVNFGLRHPETGGMPENGSAANSTSL